jgi:murein DD-endopeptidase MepM/ murein hydrolase activator NlpD
MQIMITHGRMARTRVLSVNRWQAAVLLLMAVSLLLLITGTIYHFVFVKGVREGWPVANQLMQLVVRDEFAQRDKFMRENLDAMARRVGEVQAKLIKLEAMGERVGALIGLKPEELPAPAVPVRSAAGAKGGPYVPARSISPEQMTAMLQSLDEVADQRADLFTMLESRLMEKRLAMLLIPSSRPADVPMGSGFGFRIDPFTGQSALHTGLDYPADVGTPVMSAAGGVVIYTDQNAAYGNTVEIDHGRGLKTRYAHNSRILVKTGDLVKRGQVIAEVGNTGRSTGPHLHFEVLVDGVPQDPEKFLAKAMAPVAGATAKPLKVFR